MGEIAGMEGAAGLQDELEIALYILISGLRVEEIP